MKTRRKQRVPEDRPWWSSSDWLDNETPMRRYDRLVRADKFDKQLLPSRWADEVPKLFHDLVLAPMGVQVFKRAEIFLFLHRLASSPDTRSEYDARLAAFRNVWVPSQDRQRQGILARNEARKAAQNPELSSLALENYRENSASAETLAMGRKPGGRLGGGTAPKGPCSPHPFDQSTGFQAAPSPGPSAVRPIPLDADVATDTTYTYSSIQEFRAQQTPAAVSFWSLVYPDGDCWAWAGPRTASGWGVDAWGRLAMRSAFLAAAARHDRLAALAAESVGEPWGLTNVGRCKLLRLCCNPAHWRFSRGKTPDWRNQVKVDSGREAVIGVGTPDEVAWRLTRDAGLHEVMEQLNEYASRHKQVMQEDAVQRMAWAQQFQSALVEVLQLTKQQHEEIASFRAALQEQAGRTRRLDALLHEALRSSVASRFVLDMGDQTSIHPTLPTAVGDGCVVERDDAGATPERGQDIVEDLPLVLLPQVPPLFQPMDASVRCSTGSSLEKMTAVGECARTWLLARRGEVGDMRLDQLQEVADAFAETLAGFLYDRTAFVYGLSLLLEAAAMDERCDGTLGWVRDNVRQFAGSIHERLRQQAQLGQSIDSKPQVV